jgi:predicted Zn-dependent peptidase
MPNGLRVILAPDTQKGAAPVIAVNVTYDVGSRDEKPGKSGFAHLFEHMMFQGSENVGRGEHIYLINANGGQMNGSTSLDRTNYYESLPANQLEMALFLEADRMRSLDVSQENLDNQRSVVQERSARATITAPTVVSTRHSRIWRTRTSPTSTRRSARWKT